MPAVTKCTRCSGEGDASDICAPYQLSAKPQDTHAIIRVFGGWRVETGPSGLGCATCRRISDDGGMCSAAAGKAFGGSQARTAAQQNEWLQRSTAARMAVRVVGNRDFTACSCRDSDAPLRWRRRRHSQKARWPRACLGYSTDRHLKVVLRGLQRPMAATPTLARPTLSRPRSRARS